MVVVSVAVALVTVVLAAVVLVTVVVVVVVVSIALSNLDGVRIRPEAAGVQPPLLYMYGNDGLVTESTAQVELSDPGILRTGRR